MQLEDVSYNSNEKLDKEIIMDTQFIIIAVTLLAFAALGFMLSRSIKNLEKQRAAQKKKKGRTKYMPQVKTPGK